MPGAGSHRGSLVDVRHAATCAALLAATVTTAVSGCGFVGASDVSHSKPDGFVLRGHVSTTAPAGDPRADGAACAAPTSLPDIAAGAAVKVFDPGHTLIGSGTLGPGVISTAGGTPWCNFPFAVRSVPGGVATYSVAVGNQQPRDFPAAELREDKPAVITLAVTQSPTVR
jgi:hypothetical protein